MSIPIEANRTPILDRQESLPEWKAPRSSSASNLGGGIVLIVAVAAAWVFGPSAFISVWRWIGMSTRLSPLTWFEFVCAGVAAVAFHEIGHVLGGICAGFRIHSLRVGPLEFRKPLRISAHRGLRMWIGGWANMSPTESDHLVHRALVLVLSGPAASIGLGCLFLILPFAQSPVTHVFILVSIAGGLGDLLPFGSPPTLSDGRRAWMLLRQRAQAERWVALMKLNGELARGAMPESLPTDYVAKAISVRDNSAETVAGYAIAYSRAFHLHQDAEAASLLETCLAHSSFSAPAVREALMSDAAVFQARRRKRPDIAEQWLAAMPARPQFPGLRARAEAAIFEAQGEIEAATRKLEEFEAEVGTLSNPAQREIVLRMLRRWKSELSADFAAESSPATRE